MSRDVLASSGERKVAIIEQAPPAGDTAGVSLMLLRLGVRWFAIDVHAVAEVALKGVVTRVPTAPSHIQGIASLRGRLVTVVCMEQLLGGDGPLSGESTATLPRLVVLRHGEYEMAVVAESIHVIGQHADPIHVGDGPPKPLPEFIRQELTWNGNQVALLDVPKLVAMAARMSGVQSTLDMVEA